MGFFASLPAATPGASAPRSPTSLPRWARRPQGVLGTFVPLTPVAIATADALLVVDRLMAFPGGFEFTLSVWAPNDTRPLPPFPHWHWDRSSPELPANVIRLGIAFSDGRSATNFNLLDDEAVSRGGPVLHPIDESGYQPHWEVEYWVGPLPPQGPLTLLVKWPAQGIAETAMDLDSHAIRDAGELAELVWG